MHSFRLKSLFILLTVTALVLNACQAASPLPPISTLDLITVEITPALSAYQPVLAECATQVQGMGLALTETPANDLSLDRADFILRLGEPGDPAAFSASLGSLQLELLTHSQSSLEVISVTDLAALYNPQPGSENLQYRLYTYLPGDDLRAAFEKILGTPSGRQVIEAPTQQDVLTEISSQTGSFGYFLSSQSTIGLKHLRILGLNPADLEIPVMAISREEPAGLKRAYLACLQSQPVQAP